MSLVHGQTSASVLTPLLVDATGRPLVVVDSIGVVTVVGSVNATIVAPLTAGGAVKVDQQTLPVPVSDNGGALTVDGSVSLSGQPITVDGSGVTQPVSGTVAISSLPAVDTELPAAAALADGAANPTTPIVGAAGLRYNGATFDRERGVEAFSVLASAARTATTLSATFTNHNARGLMVGWNITAVPGIQTVTLEIYAQTSPIGIQPILLTSTAKVATGTFVYIILPGTAAAGAGIDAVAGFPIPRFFLVRISHSGAGSFTYAVDGCLLI